MQFYKDQFNVFMFLSEVNVYYIRVCIILFEALIKFISHVKLFKGYLLPGQRSHFYLLSFFKEADLGEGTMATYFC